MKNEYDDNGGNFPTLKSASDYINGLGKSNTSKDYHNDRIRAIEALVQKIGFSKPINILDFGCGDGMYIKKLFQPNDIGNLISVDVSQHMVKLASKNLNKYKFKGLVGGVDVLKKIQLKFDLIFAVDVLGYLNSDEETSFYLDAFKLLVPNGKLIVMYGNELFDMYALNRGSASFFNTYFDVYVSDLLVEGGSPQYIPAKRKNPLSYPAELNKFGFEMENQSFSQWHKVPPAIGNRNQSNVNESRLKMRDHGFDANKLSDKEIWKALFRCSIFAQVFKKNNF